jgi:hypothetical protein
MKMLERLRLQEQIKNVALTGKSDPKLQQELKETKKGLNSILTKWKFGNKPIKTAPEFISKFEPWINGQLEKQKELQEFLKSKGVNNLSEL